MLRKAQRIVEGLNWLRVAVVTEVWRGGGGRSPNTGSKLWWPVVNPLYEDVNTLVTADVFSV